MGVGGISEMSKASRRGVVVERHLRGIRDWACETRGRSGRDEAMAVRASGLRDRASEAMVGE